MEIQDGRYFCKIVFVIADPLMYRTFESIKNCQRCDFFLKIFVIPGGNATHHKFQRGDTSAPLPNRSGRYQGTTPTTWLNFNTPCKSQPTILPYYCQWWAKNGFKKCYYTMCRSRSAVLQSATQDIDSCMMRARPHWNSACLRPSCTPSKEQIRADHCPSLRRFTGSITITPFILKLHIYLGLLR